MSKKNKKTILAIETSCDDSGVAVLEFDPAFQKSPRILFNAISSQVNTHAPFGGVVPNLAARDHQKNLPLLIQRALKGIKKTPDFIAVTKGPGLIPALLVGVATAKSLSFLFQKPILPIHHLRGHVSACFVKDGEVKIPDFKKMFPALVLIVSGGHTELALMQNWNKFDIIGETLDDAVGEAFDKAARLLDLGYPGGPIIAKLAENGDSKAHALPRPMATQKNLNFSFSGLKTALFYLVKDKQAIDIKQKADIAASFQQAAVETLKIKTKKAIFQFRPKTLILSGGVAANKNLREVLQSIAHDDDLNFLLPEIKNCTDNALMIALAAYLDLKNGKKTQDWSQVQANANWKLE